MANHLQPTLTSTYSNFVTQLDYRFDDLARGLDPATSPPLDDPTISNVPVNSIRWSSGSNKWQKYNGSAWNDLAVTYAISISGNAATVTNGVYNNGGSYGINITGNASTASVASSAVKLETTNWIVEEISSQLYFKTAAGVLKFSMSATDGLTVY